jgi:hypothetical protein
MPASEYGSNYWCVMLKGTEDDRPGDSVHLHADSVAMDPAGTLTFMSLGRRTAGADPNKTEQKDNGQSKGGEEKGEGKEDHRRESTIYIAFAPGTWRVFYAAKLQDGSPASVEHWNASNGKPELASVPAHSGAEGFTREPTTA